jgi:hypothetical protein
MNAVSRVLLVSRLNLKLRGVSYVLSMSYNYVLSQIRIQTCKLWLSVYEHLQIYICSFKNTIRLLCFSLSLTAMMNSQCLYSQLCVYDNFHHKPKGFCFEYVSVFVLQWRCVLKKVCVRVCVCVCIHICINSSCNTYVEYFLIYVTTKKRGFMVDIFATFVRTSRSMPENYCKQKEDALDTIFPSSLLMAIIASSAISDIVGISEKNIVPSIRRLLHEGLMVHGRLTCIFLFFLFAAKWILFWKNFNTRLQGFGNIKENLHFKFYLIRRFQIWTQNSFFSSNIFKKL